MNGNLSLNGSAAEKNPGFAEVYYHMGLTRRALNDEVMTGWTIKTVQ
jgi:hypothetical protein